MEHKDCEDLNGNSFGEASNGEGLLLPGKCHGGGCLDVPAFLSQVSGELQKMLQAMDGFQTQIAQLDGEIVKRSSVLTGKFPARFANDSGLEEDKFHAMVDIHGGALRQVASGDTTSFDRVAPVDGTVHVMSEIMPQWNRGEDEIEEMKAQFKRVATSANEVLSVSELYAVAFESKKGISYDILRELCYCLEPCDKGKAVEGLTLNRFLRLRCGHLDSVAWTPEVHAASAALCVAFEQEEQKFQLSNNRSHLRREQKRATIKTVADVFIVFVIVINALVIGLSADINPEAPVWMTLEIIFFVIYVLEFILKCWLFGVKNYFVGPDMAWNLFDFTCLVISAVDLGMALGAQAEAAAAVGAKKEKGTSWNLLKILRVSRLARVVRLMRFRIFKELKLMIMGLVSGLRALFWAVVLLMALIYTFSVVASTMIPDVPEFASIDRSMFTLFRCFTESCDTLDSKSIPEMLYRKYGWPFQLIWIWITMGVTIGLFNLIMAVFIDNVTKSQSQRKQRELSDSAIDTEVNLKLTLARFINDPGAQQGRSWRMTKRLNKLKTVSTSQSGKDKADAAESAFRILQDDNVTIKREVFVAWLQDPEFVQVLEDADIDISNKFELFNILDVDNGGELSIQELLTGLLKLRGDVSKGDIVSILLRTRDLALQVQELRGLVGSDS